MPVVFLTLRLNRCGSVKMAVSHVLRQLLIQTCSFHFISARHIIQCAERALCNYPSACHTGGSVKTVVEVRIIRIVQFSPYSSSIPLVFGIFGE